MSDWSSRTSFHQRYAALVADPGGVNELLEAGRDRAAAFAAPRLDSAMRAIGLMT